MQRTHNNQTSKKSNNLTKNMGQTLNRYFPAKKDKMANRHVRRYSISLIVGDVHIKTMM